MRCRYVGIDNHQKLDRMYYHVFGPSTLSKTEDCDWNSLLNVIRGAIFGYQSELLSVKKKNLPLVIELHFRLYLDDSICKTQIPVDKRIVDLMEGDMLYIRFNIRRQGKYMEMQLGKQGADKRIYWQQCLCVDLFLNMLRGLCFKDDPNGTVVFLVSA